MKIWKMSGSTECTQYGESGANSETGIEFDFFIILIALSEFSNPNTFYLGCN